MAKVTVTYHKTYNLKITQLRAEKYKDVEWKIDRDCVIFVYTSALYVVHEGCLAEKTVEPGNRPFVVCLFAHSSV